MIIPQRNMMATPELTREETTMTSHIREIGPHGHEWVPVHVDASQNAYEECALCGTRKVTRSAGVPRQDWVDGGDWDAPSPETAESTAEPGSDEAVEDDLRKASAAENAAMGMPAGAGTPTALVRRGTEDNGDGDNGPSDAKVRRMSEADMRAYADELGVDYSDDPTRKELADRIIAHRTAG